MPLIPVLSITERPRICDKYEGNTANATADAEKPNGKPIMTPGGAVGRAPAVVGGGVPGGGGGGGGGKGAPGSRGAGSGTSLSLNPFFPIVSSYTGISRISR